MPKKEISAANTGVKKPRGKPFQKGNKPANAFTSDDPRANRSGQRSASVVAFNSTLRQMLVDEGMETLRAPTGEEIPKIRAVVKKIYKMAWEDGEQWAVNLIFERIEGKVTQPVKHEFDDLPDADIIKRAAQLTASIAKGLASVAAADGEARTG